MRPDDFDPEARKPVARPARGAIKGMPHRLETPGIVTRPATELELRRFRWIGLNRAQTQVIGLTTDVDFALHFGEWREYVRDWKTGQHEWEVTFNVESVPVALRVLGR